jgi:signal transduction protein with GAF and PtsI domain
MVNFVEIAKRQFAFKRADHHAIPCFIASMTPRNDWENILREILQEFDCQTGSLHRTLEDDRRNLTLVAQTGVPESLLDKISHIPFGKGIAGAAAATKAPVELCNLQQDLGGVAQPDARRTGVVGALAVPIFNTAADQVIGTLGIGKFVPYSFSADEKHALAAHALRIARYFEHKEG